jgi:hypothetical protein
METTASLVGVGLGVARATATSDATSATSATPPSLINEVRLTRRNGAVQVVPLQRFFATFRRSVRTSTRKLRNETYHNTFLAHDCVEWICKR